MTTACVHANGIDIYYVEAGEGEPLLLVDNAMVSTNPAWAAIPFAYASFLGTLAEHFRVIAPDTRGSGKSVHPGGPIPATLLADDVAALIEALNLDRPLICGFSDGGETATLVGIRHPGSVRAIVNHGDMTCSTRIRTHPPSPRHGRCSAAAPARPRRTSRSARAARRSYRPCSS